MLFVPDQAFLQVQELLVQPGQILGKQFLQPFFYPFPVIRSRVSRFTQVDGFRKRSSSAGDQPCPVSTSLR